MDPDPKLRALLRALATSDAEEELLDEEPAPATSPFGERLGAALRVAVDAMRREGVLEVAEDDVEGLVVEATEAGLDSNSPKQLMKQVLQALLASDRVEEIYGTDEMLKATLGRFLGAA